MTALPDLVRTIALADMVAYAGATWDWHRLHYDPAFLAEKGLPAPVVDGQVLGALMAEQVLDSFGPTAFITEMAFRFSAMVFAGETVTVHGEVTGHEGDLLTVRQTVTADDRTAVDGATTTVRVPSS